MPRYPGPKSKAAIEKLERYVIVEPYPFVVDIRRCEGMWLATLDGQRIFDWAGYYASKLICHNHPRMYEPEYLQKLSCAANNKLANPDFLTPECLEYYQTVYELAPRCMQNSKLEVYVVNSGAEAVENMMKYFVNLHQEKQFEKRQIPATRRFVYFEQAFHGRTVFALNVTRISHEPVVTKDFHGFMPGNIQIPFPAIDNEQSAEENNARTRRSLEILEDTLKLYPNEIVGIIVEPVQGAGGHRIAQPEFFQGVSRLARKYDVLLGFDEVQTAGGQTGTFFTIDQFNLPFPPDAVASAKKLGNGVVYMLAPMKDLGVLDSTWGGSLADMVRFVQEMKIVREEKLIEAVPEKAEYLKEKLEQFLSAHKSLVANVRGFGLYMGFSFRNAQQRNKFQEAALQEEDLLLMGAGTDSIRLRPSLSVTKPDIDLLIQKMERVAAKLEQEKT